MKRVISTEKVPIKLWLDDIDDNALAQAKNLANLPFVFKHVAIMPDAHMGYGMPIGGVLATNNVVIPNAVGVDIGCGVCAVKTNIREMSTENLKKIMSGIRKVIPLGFNHHKTDQEWSGFNHSPSIQVVQQELSNAAKQLGTLGGGNHFIEIQKSTDEVGFIYIMIHSGSRNFGLKIANRYNKIAQEICELYHSNVPIGGPDGLAFLPACSVEGKEYMAAMEFALKFARKSRQLMMDKVREVVFNLFQDNECGDVWDIHHNYASRENHFGRNVIVHRKGATSAKLNEIGIIPGSQGTHSYIVKGLGNPESFMSCSHGAGRKMGRIKARNTLDLSIEKGILNELGIIHSIRSQKDLDEAPGAYKDIATVMNNQNDLVKIVTELRPLGVIKA
jgi:tRNA-splicing ligase RtcB